MRVRHPRLAPQLPQALLLALWEGAAVVGLRQAVLPPQARVSAASCPPGWSGSQAPHPHQPPQQHYHHRQWQEVLPEMLTWRRVAGPCVRRALGGQQVEGVLTVVTRLRRLQQRLLLPPPPPSGQRGLRVRRGLPQRPFAGSFAA